MGHQTQASGTILGSSFVRVETITRSQASPGVCMVRVRGSCSPSTFEDGPANGYRRGRSGERFSPIQCALLDAPERSCVATTCGFDDTFVRYIAFNASCETSYWKEGVMVSCGLDSDPSYYLHDVLDGMCCSSQTPRSEHAIPMTYRRLYAWYDTTIHRFREGWHR